MIQCKEIAVIKELSFKSEWLKELKVKIISIIIIIKDPASYTMRIKSMCKRLKQCKGLVS